MTTDNDGNPFSLTEIFIKVTGTLANGLEKAYVCVAVGGGSGITSNAQISNSFKYIGYVRLVAPKQTIAFTCASGDTSAEYMSSSKIDMWGNRYVKSFQDSDNFERIRLFPATDQAIFAAGTKYWLYGR